MTIKTKKILKILAILAAIFILVVFIRFVIGGSEDDWICVKGKWVKHGMPNAPMPTEQCN